jgi:hypothetical protein
MSPLYKMSYPSNNNTFNSSKANIAKLFLLTFLGVQGIRQLVLVNSQANGKLESRAGQVSAWLTITMTLVAAFVLYQPNTPHRIGLAALFAAAMGSGIAMIYDYTQSTTTVEGKKTRLFFGVAHVILALLVLVYLILSNSP